MAEPSISVLQKMYETGAWSDFTIRTATKDFKVHKTVVCAMSPFFQAACTGNWQEARENLVVVEENERVIHGLLQYVYEMEVDLVERVDHGRAPLGDDTAVHEEFSDLVTLSLAVDKYQIEFGSRFQDHCMIAATGCFRRTSSLAAFTSIGVRCFESDKPGYDVLRSAAVAATIPKLKEIFSDGGAAWKNLYYCEEYLKAILEIGCWPPTIRQHERAPPPQPAYTHQPVYPPQAPRAMRQPNFMPGPPWAQPGFYYG